MKEKQMITEYLNEELDKDTQIEENQEKPKRGLMTEYLIEEQNVTEEGVKKPLKN